MKLYCEIFGDKILGTLSNLGIRKMDIDFQQNNDLKHTSKLATDWFLKSKINKLECPANSPDVNIIKHAWNHLNKRVHFKSPFLKNFGKLWDVLVKWGIIKDNYIRKLYKSMLQRVQAVLEAKGVHIKH